MCVQEPSVTSLICVCAGTQCNKSNLCVCRNPVMELMTLCQSLQMGVPIYDTIPKVRLSPHAWHHSQGKTVASRLIPGLFHSYAVCSGCCFSDLIVYNTTPKMYHTLLILFSLETWQLMPHIAHLLYPHKWNLKGLFLSNFGHALICLHRMIQSELLTHFLCDLVESSHS